MGEVLSTDEKELGRRLRKLRLDRGMSLAEAASVAEISPSFLSHVENGKGDITFLRLQRLVHAYGIGLMDIFPPEHELPEVVRASEGTELRSSTEGMSLHLLAPDTSRAMVPVLGRLEPGAKEVEFGSHNTEAFYHVLKGQLKIVFESGREIILRKGDSIYLAAPERRKTENASRGVTITLGVTYWPRR